MKDKILITGSLGLIGSSAVDLFEKEFEIYGVDNHQRKHFFGKEVNQKSVDIKNKKYKNYHHLEIDIRDTSALEDLFKRNIFKAVIHTAAQPSHDKAKEIPLDDFSINAGATLNLLELTRKYSPRAAFIFTSTNKVYGDKPNTFTMVEKKTRYEFSTKELQKGISETCSIDASTHSLFGVSKLSADMYVQEYGRYFNMNTVCFRLGCVTGEDHQGVKNHGFLSYLVKSIVHYQKYQVIGYKGKQVRDQIHAKDVVLAMFEYYKKPSQAAVYNLGGGEENSASVIELIETIKKKASISKVEVDYINTPRMGDHICYVTDFSKFKKDYPKWRVTISLEEIIDRILKKELDEKQN